MAQIVLIHGVGAQNSSALSLDETWLPALAGGVTNAGYGDIAKRIAPPPLSEPAITVDMAFYGTLFLKNGEYDAEAVSRYPAIIQTDGAKPTLPSLYPGAAGPADYRTCSQAGRSQPAKDRQPGHTQGSRNTR